MPPSLAHHTAVTSNGARSEVPLLHVPTILTRFAVACLSLGFHRVKPASRGDLPDFLLTALELQVLRHAPHHADQVRLHLLEPDPQHGVAVLLRCRPPLAVPLPEGRGLHAPREEEAREVVPPAAEAERRDVHRVVELETAVSFGLRLTTTSLAAAAAAA
eukprot:CAMPEP_0184379756 /NCGR_PEP_ID=MMETSP0007-20130409/4138_1 /TAXON_ID=97485 /ORGANISM="Prymnesium parvum, Strain Texoma1" /LENGTH=159 /DNA_ID=CAMNT_0026724623 /DNA_START=236 /DNA_END=714 /DNA_ORIENTATION=+